MVNKFDVTKSTKPRVCCLYRVSTDKQVDHNDKNEADIPMQRKECHRFAAQMGWEIVHEEQEEGVSGHKVRAAKRDKLQNVKELALQGEFEILLVFMFDRIGRISDETPFVVEWFVKNGIQVWSTQEGEQRFDNHIDKLLNYIRFWQADGESVKTSIRTKTSLGQLVEDGHFKGGLAAYGYDLVKGGRINKKKHELFDLKKNEDEAHVVKIIFEKLIVNGYGAQRIATHLNESGYRNRKGKCWHPASIRGILRNPLYTGVLRSGESHSDILPELQIITPEDFMQAQNIMRARAERVKEMPTVPMNTQAKSLLSGNVFCGHCGARLSTTTNGRYRRRSDGSMDTTERVRYVCYGKTRKQTDCTGPTGYTCHKIDDAICIIVRDIFRKMKDVPKEQMVMNRMEDELRELRAHRNTLKQELAKAEKELTVLKQEIIKCLCGESVFTKEMLSAMIKDAEAKCTELQGFVEQSEREEEDQKSALLRMNSEYEKMISLADLFETADHSAKKMVINKLIRRVEVSRGYRLKISFNISVEQFCRGLDLNSEISLEAGA